MSILSPKYKRDFYKILPFGIIWLIFGLIFLWIEYAAVIVLGDQKFSKSTIYLTPKIFLFASTSIFFIGCFVGFLEVRFINKYFVTKSFPTKLIGKLTIYVVLMLVIMFIFYHLAASIEMQKSVFSTEVFERYKFFFFSITNISTSIQLAFSLFVSLLYAEVRDNLGQNVLLNFFIGKYHKPVVENRTFMFTDMKDSTKIAEELGNVKYFNFLRSYYNDLSAAILNHNGEVYQYIGDEIVISWQNTKCNAAQNSVDCFFDMQQRLSEKKEEYIKNYNAFPEFKAAIHKGDVTVGEIGALKKEIFFTGDVLNTTARIQNLCNEYNSDLLISELIAKDLKTDNFELKPINNVALKGKANTINIVGVQKKVE
ncbi:adenylate/guanylate cyclase domain-containing protein [Polaribacter reichenbachii]|uniref:Adenylate cyclase n=1 Tax=Polaribacter reichenbachii TaxID=996801 RepID=A0A1B8TNJ4_9FLAO|nr:adenylate/guanylate cyclase domain-containing protein [Polaribacter reichenbachii]APZ46678.1 adenylate/guanylate cyclase domain-containing protein [Polaribacter reichenbachii]AUC17321.1 adenylate/guanylate cyclase domain-containing protein [Polaribacter reichenbachii]OBY61230.1 adenylate cyclase [Polaribacter reichenbachii]